jgi:hypothetical protein
MQMFNPQPPPGMHFVIFPSAGSCVGKKVLVLQLAEALDASNIAIPTARI